MRQLWQRPEPAAGPPSNPAEIADRAVHRRAIEAVIWGMPAVNFELMRRQMVKLGGAANQVVFWSRPVGWKNQTLTPNPDTIYVMPFFDTTDVGPMVMEIPPADSGTIVGSIDDCWQTAIEDVGVAGVDKGAGGRYLILPPDHEGGVPDGYIAMPSPTYKSYALLRSNYRSAADADIADAVAYGKRVRVYPLSAAANPPQTTYVDANDTLFDATIPYDVRFFDALNGIVADRAVARPRQGDDRHAEGHRHREGSTVRARRQDTADLQSRGTRSTFMVGESTGYVVLSAALLRRRPLACARLRRCRQGHDVELRRHEQLSGRRSRGHLLAGLLQRQTTWCGPVLLDGTQGRKGATASTAAAPTGCAYPHPLLSTSTGRRPPTTVRSHALIRDTPRSSRASTTPGLVVNDDGAVDIFFGPTAPDGASSNWVPTKACNSFEVLFRFYGPDQPLFDKTWKLPDIEKLHS